MRQRSVVEEYLGRTYHPTSAAGGLGVEPDRDRELAARINPAASNLTNSRTDRGVLYIATGAQHVGEATTSAESVRHHCPDIPIALISDVPVQCKTFDLVLPAENPTFSWLDRVRLIGSTPFAKTVFLDTDTFCLLPFEELFDLLDRFEFAAAHAPNRPSGLPLDSSSNANRSPSSAFPSFNGGVLVFRQSPAVAAVLATWYETFSAAVAAAKRVVNDQATLCKALYESNLRIATLTPEYNFRLGNPTFACGAVKIIHGRPARYGLGNDPRAAFERIGVALNAELGGRAFLSGVGIAYGDGRRMRPI